VWRTIVSNTIAEKPKAVAEGEVPTVSSILLLWVAISRRHEDLIEEPEEDMRRDGDR
jgi:hypothetical protein